MKKGALFLLLVLAAISIAAAEDGYRIVGKSSDSNTVISGADIPAVYNFYTFNPGTNDSCEIYSFAGASFKPGFFNLSSGYGTLTTDVYLNERAKDRNGDYIFDYEINCARNGKLKDQMDIMVSDLKEAVKITAKSLRYDDDEAELKIKNTQNLTLNNLGLAFNSKFFKSNYNLSLRPYEEKTIFLKVIKENVVKFSAGSYVFNTEASLAGANSQLTSTLNYLEKQNVLIDDKTSGFFVRTRLITRSNEGNVPVKDEIIIYKNILSRLFTTGSVEPTSTVREGLMVKYQWTRDLKPSESWTIKVTTSYTIPFIMLLLIAAIAWMVYAYSRTDVMVQKRVSFVKTKGGQFALRVNLRVKARKPVENVKITDRIPGVAKLYEGFGSKPHSIDHNTRRMFWNIDRLNAGEERHFTYIIYSEINVVGRFELPVTNVEYTKDNTKKSTNSNKTYFVADIHPKFS